MPLRYVSKYQILVPQWIDILINKEAFKQFIFNLSVSEHISNNKTTKFSNQINQTKIIIRGGLIVLNKTYLVWWGQICKKSCTNNIYL